MKFALKYREGMHIEKKGKRVAIVGAGPAGLTAAGELICFGYDVNVYDQMPEPGGLLIFGIPEARIPKETVREGVNQLRDLGVVFNTNITVGRDIDIMDLVREHDAVLVATGTWKSREMGLVGEELNGIHHALNYIVDYHLSKFGYRRLFHKPSGDKRVMVIGGGLTAVDACMIASEMGVKRISLIYRRTKKEAPAGPFEIEKLEKSGIAFRELVQPVEFIGNGRVEAVKAIRMALGELDSTGRLKPIPIDNSEYLIPADIVLVAVGLEPTLPNPEKFAVEAEKEGVIKTDESFKTNIEKVFAAGDVKHGPTRIGPAMQSGMKVAKHIDEYLLKLG